MARMTMGAAALACALFATAAPAAAQMYGDETMRNLRTPAMRNLSIMYLTGIVRGMRMVEGMRSPPTLFCVPNDVMDGTIRETVQETIPTINGWRAMRVDELVLISLVRTYPCSNSRGS